MLGDGVRRNAEAGAPLAEVAEMVPVAPGGAVEAGLSLPGSAVAGEPVADAREVRPGTPRDPEQRLSAGERRFLTLLSFFLGVSMGCGSCFYVGSGSYFSDRFDDDHFFVNACAWFYLPPILVTVLQLLLDHRFDRCEAGIRSVIRCRIYTSSILMALCLGVTGLLAVLPDGPAIKPLVYASGVGVSIFAAAFTGAASALFGAVDSRFVPYLILGLTAAGVFTNAVARAVGMGPGCHPQVVLAYFLVSVVAVLVITVAYALFSRLNLMEGTYKHHEWLLSSRFSLPAYDLTPPPFSADDLVHEAAPARCLAFCKRAAPMGLPLICWLMGLVQMLAIAMNMSLTPLANQVAHGDHWVSQELVLVKLLSDFVGRTFFLLLPRPSFGRPCGCPKGVVFQAVLVSLLQFLRMPLWALVYSRVVSPGSHSFLDTTWILVAPIWAPLISLGAFSSSLSIVVSVSFAPEKLKPTANRLMNMSMYAGFFLGIAVALLSA